MCELPLDLGFGRSCGWWVGGSAGFRSGRLAPVRCASTQQLQSFGLQGCSLLTGKLGFGFARCDGKDPNAGFELGWAPRDVGGAVVSTTGSSSHCRMWRLAGQRLAQQGCVSLRARQRVACFPMLSLYAFVKAKFPRAFRFFGTIIFEFHLKGFDRR